MQFTPALLLGSLSIAASLCFSDIAFGQNLPPAVGQLVAATKKQIKTIDMATFKSAYDRNALGLIVDVREADEYADGYIPGAINVPRGVIELKIWSYVGFPERTDIRKKITLYCGSGMRCVLAAKSLHDLGFSDVTAADMRIDEWAKAGYRSSRSSGVVRRRCAAVGFNFATVRREKWGSKATRIPHNT